MDFHLLAGFFLGFLASIPITVCVCYVAYIKISQQVRSIVNEYGRA
nr:ORF3a [Apple luteovirus 1]UYP65668.1 P3a protein [Apple luteovirus 1]UYP65690.1 P3a protein [Apple luteovirus 1]UZN45255.1 P3a protein [Apple luteovirus 1]UZN45264.1 P3a protein [Apple luteovirus 1]